MLVPSSLPTHTPTISDSLKPMNQASRWFWLVPVFPAAKPLSAAALRCRFNDAPEQSIIGC
jgi:hypothetical protein